MPVRTIPECARYSRCGVALAPPTRGRSRDCARRARFMVEGPGRPPLQTCPRHVQMAVLQPLWSAEGS